LVLTLAEMMEALGGAVKLTVFRKLRELDYRSSYSHAGKYYTLDELGHWDVYGLWAYQGIHFSRHGSLLATLQHLIDTSPSGCFAEELEQRVLVRVHNTLSTLHRRGQVARHQIVGAFLYVSVPGGDRQLLRRQRAEQEKASAAHDEEVFSQVADSLQVFLATLNERQRRLYAGFEALKLGHGGDATIAQVTGLNVKTVARGRRELLAGNIDPDRIRAVGAGRPSLKKNRNSRGTGAPAEG
jgi:hypothetical protein